jgi:hypothetical protein
MTKNSLPTNVWLPTDTGQPRGSDIRLDRVEHNEFPETMR